MFINDKLTWGVIIIKESDLITQHTLLLIIRTPGTFILEGTQIKQI